MSIRRNPKRKNKQWECRWKEDGTHYSRSFRSRKEAEIFDATQKAKLHSGNGYRTRDEKIPLDVYAEKYLSRSKQASTTVRNRGIYKRHVQPVFGAVPIRYIRHTDVLELVDTWEKAGLSSRTIVRQIAVLSAIFKLAERDGVIYRIPTEGIKAPEATTPHRYSMTIEEVLALRSAIHPNYEAFIYTLIETGMRIGEAIKLNIEDFDWENKTVKIHGAKTAAGNRTVLLSSTAWSMIRTHIQSTGRTMLNQSEPLFVSHKVDKETGLVMGSRINYSNFRNRIFRVAATEIGLPDLQPHDLRRTAATFLVDSESSEKAIQEQMGHADIRTTLNLYAQATAKAREESVSRMEAVLNPEPSSGGLRV